jgi:hypothetical protein
MSDSEVNSPFDPDVAADFFSLLRDKWGIDHKKISKPYTNAHQFAWEQVLILVIYSRQFCYNESFNPFAYDAQGRMLLIQLAYELCTARNHEKNQPAGFALVHYVLKLLDDGAGIVEVIQALSKEDQASLVSNEDSKQADEQATAGECVEKSDFTGLKRQLLSCIQSRHVTFQPYALSALVNVKPFKPMYRHGMLYAGLVSPVEMFQPLLAIEDISEDAIFFSKFLHALNSSVCSRFTISHSLHDPEKLKRHREITERCKKVRTLEELKCFLSDFPEVIDLSFQSDFKSMLMEGLAHATNGAFDIARRWEPELKGKFSRSVFANVCEEAGKSNGKLSLEIDLMNLKTIHEIGFLDEVVDSLRDKLLDNLGYGVNRGRNWRIAIPAASYGLAFDELSLWYEDIKRAKARLFIKLRDVPSLVAAVIYSDFKFEQGAFCSNLFPSSALLPEKLTASEEAMFVTCLIHYCLYKPLPFEMFINMTLFGDELSTPKISAEDDLKTALEKVNAYLGEQQQINFKERYYYSPDNLWPNNTLMKQWKDVSRLSADDDSGIQGAQERLKKTPSYLKPIRRDGNQGGKGSRRILDTEDYICKQRAAGAKSRHKYPIDINFRLPLWASVKAEPETAAQ